MRNGHANPELNQDLVPPPPERGQHDEIIRSDRQVPDSRGAVGLPWRAVGLLLRLHHNARITDDELAAAYRFRADFDRGHLDTLRASNLARQRVDGPRFRRETSISVDAAKERAMDAISAVGGINSPGGSCLWHVVGAGETLKDWALTRYTARRITENAAPGVLYAALVTLVSYYHRGKQ
jgi:hypothetical protein